MIFIINQYVIVQHFKLAELKSYQYYLLNHNLNSKNGMYKLKLNS